MSSLLIIVTCLFSSKTVLQYNDGKVCWLPPDLSLNDKPAYKQSKCKADRRKECKETNIEKDSTNKEYAAPHFKNSSCNEHDPHSKHACKQNYCQTCNRNGYDIPAPVIIVTIQTIASTWDHPPIVLKTKPLKLENVPAINAIFVSTAQKSVLTIVTTTEIETASQLLTQVHILVIQDTPLSVMDCIFMMATYGIGFRLRSLPQF